MKKAVRFVERAKKLILEFPEVVQNCPNAPQTCVTVDRGPDIQKLRELFAESANAVKRNIDRDHFRRTGKQFENSLSYKAQKLLKQRVEFSSSRVPVLLSIVSKASRIAAR